jgi:hypothetical protein
MGRTCLRSESVEALARPLRLPNVLVTSQAVPTPSKAERCLGKVLLQRPTGGKFAYFVTQLPHASFRRMTRGASVVGQRHGAESPKGQDLFGSVNPVVEGGGLPVDKAP